MRVAEYLAYTRSSGQTLMLVTYPRQFGFRMETPWGNPENSPPGWKYLSGPRPPEERDWFLATKWKDSWFGFNLIRVGFPLVGGGQHITSVLIPFWFLMVLTLMTPLCWLRRWRRQARRVRLGLCLHCGYDLRATPAPTGPRLPRCPECGRLDNAT